VAEWLSFEEGLKASGLRIAPVRSGVASGWSELCKGLFHVKAIPFALISARDPKLGLSALKAATAQESLPVVFWESERPRANWLEQLFLAERLSQAPALLPHNPSYRALVVGLLAELCAEDGFGWHRRILLTNRLLNEPQFGERERAIGRYLADKYGYARATIAASQRRCEDIVMAFADRLSSGSRFLCGDALTALDIGWATFAAMIQPLPADQCPMDALWRDLFTWVPKSCPPDKVAALLEHRNQIYRDWLELPVVVR